MYALRTDVRLTLDVEVLSPSELVQFIPLVLPSIWLANIRSPEMSPQMDRIVGNFRRNGIETHRR